MRHVGYVTDPATGRRFAVPAGAAEDTTPVEAAEAAEPDGEPDPEPQQEADGDEDDAPLGEAGEKALREFKKRAREAERELRRLQQEQNKPDEDTTDPEELREQLRKEIQAEAAKERALDKVEAKAARKFHNPDLVRKLLADQADDFLDGQGNPDVEAISDALEELLETEPYLALDTQRDQRFQGKADGGTRNGSTPSQLTRDDLKRMGPDEIEQARLEGRLNTLLGK